MASFRKFLRSRTVRFGLLLVWLAITVTAVIGAYRLWNERSLAEERLQQANLALHQASLASLNENVSSTRLQLQLHRQFRDHFQNVVDSTAQDITQRPQRARALSLLGQLHRQNRNFTKALAACQEAEKLYVEMDRETPVPELTTLQADNQLHLSALLVDLHQIQPALEAIHRAKKGLESLPVEHLGHAGPQLSLAAAHHNLAILALQAGNHEEAITHFQQRLSILNDLVQEHPGRFFYRASCIDAMQMLTAGLWAGNRISDARHTCEAILLAVVELEQKQTALDPVECELLTVRDRVRSNVEVLARASSSEKTSPLDTPKGPLPPSWSWQFVAPQDHRLLAPDLLVRGSLPAEFEKQDALLLGFGWHDAWWALEVQIEVVQACCENIDVVFLVPDGFAEQLVREKLQQAKVSATRVRFLKVPVNTIWARDYGPITLRLNDGRYQWCDFIYPDAHGLKFRDLDDPVPTQAARELGTSSIQLPLRLNGGNLLSNGAGLLVSTRALLQDNAAIGVGEAQVTATLKRLTGAKEVIYLEPLSQESTGDIDWFASFASPNTIVVGDFAGQDPENDVILNNNVNRLRQVQVGNEKLRVVRIPMPPRYQDRVGGTYTNVIFANGVLLVPTWGNASKAIETKALNVWRDLLPGWKVVGINADPLGKTQGGLRCASITVSGIPKFSRFLSEKENP